MSGRIRVGVIGLGYFGSHHARHYDAHAMAELVGVADADAGRAAAAAERHGVAAHGHHLALVDGIDAASVVVPTAQHYAVARDLIDRGIHVFIEKPIADDVTEAADLVERAARRSVVLQVGHVERFSPAFRALQAKVREPRLIECVRRAPWTGRAADVDVVLDLMIHDIDLALSLAGAPVSAVSASGVSVVTRSNDVVEARLTFANDVVATLSASRVATAKTRTLCVTEPGRVLMADLAKPSLSIVTRANGATRTETAALAHVDSLGAEIDAFLDSVAEGRPAVVDGKAGLDALEVAEMVLAASVVSAGALATIAAEAELVA